MILECRLAFVNIRRNWIRTLLTLTAIAAAAGVVTWMVAGYDKLLSSFDHDSEESFGRFDVFVNPMPSTQMAYLDDTLLSRLGENPEILESVQFSQVPANVMGGVMRRPGARPQAPAQQAKSDKSQAPAKHDEEQSRRQGGGQQNAMGSLWAGSGKAPPMYGLPTGGGSITGTDAATPLMELVSGEWLTGEDIRTPRGTLSECVVSEKFMKDRQLKDGAVIEAVSNAGVFKLKITGVIKSPELISGGGRMGGPSAGLSPNAVYVGMKTAKKISGGTSRITSAAIKLKEGIDPEKFRVNWQSFSAENKIKLNTVAELKASMETGMSTANARSQAFAATAISLLASFFIIFTSLSMGVDERIRQFALLRAVALTRFQMMKVIIVEALFFGLAGWAGGILSGMAFLKFSSAASSSGSGTVGMWSIVLSGVCALAGSLAASVLPLIKAVRISPVEAMSIRINAMSADKFRIILITMGIIAVPLLLVNPVIVSLGGLSDEARVLLYGVVGYTAMTLGFVLLSPVVLLVCGKIFSPVAAGLFGVDSSFLKSQLNGNFWRICGTVVSLSVGLGMYMSISVWCYSMLTAFVPGPWMPDLMLAIIPGGIEKSQMADVCAIEGIDKDRCLPLYVEQTRLAEDLTGSQKRASVVRQNNVVFMGLEVERAFGGKNPLLDFRYLTPSRDEALAKLRQDGNFCLIPEHFAREAKLGVGDPFEVISPDCGAKIKYEVAGIIDLRGWHWMSKQSGVRRNTGRTAALIFVSDRSVSLNFNLQRVNFVWTDLLEGADTKHIAEETRRLADSCVGQKYHIPGGEDVAIQNQYIKPSSLKDMNKSIMGRTEGMVSGMLQMPLIILLITSIGVMNTAMASIRARKWEIGIMRANGLSGWGLTRLVLAEAVIIGLAATALSLSFGMMAGWCGAEMASSNNFFGGMDFSFAVPWARTLTGFGITLGLCLAAALIPAVISGRRDVLTLIRDGRASM